AAVAAKNWTEAAALYVGPFLDGFYLADAPEFERWTETERATLGSDGLRAIEFLAKECAAQGRREEAAEYWRRLTRLDPVNSRVATSYMEALMTLGDRTAALAHGKAHTDLLRREFDAEPDRSVQRLMVRLREVESASGPHAVPPAAQALAVETPTTSVVTSIAPVLMSKSPQPEVRPPHRTPLVRGHNVLLAAGVVGLSIFVAMGLRSATAAHAPARPVLAVGRIRDLGAPDSAALGAVLSEMLATSLGRLNDLQVIANSRMLELTPREADTSRSALTDAARRAGATEVIEGELIPLPDRQLRLEIRRVDIARGLVRGGYRVSGGDRIALFDSVTALIAADFRVGAPTASLADVTTHSPIAYRFYEEGLRAFYQFDVYAASRLFRSAIREDSTFAMATYYAWRAAVATGDSSQNWLGERAAQLASHASDRDRLLILTHVGFGRSDPRAVFAGESLATYHTHDPDALTRAAQVINDLPRAVALLNRAIALDSAVGTRTSELCRLCDALDLLTTRYEWADSGAAVERTLNRWTALRPDDPRPWALRGDWIIGFGRRAEAMAAWRRYEMLGGNERDIDLASLVRNLRFDDFSAVDATCNEHLADADSADYEQYRWYCIIGLRMEGRYREAVALNRDGRLPGSDRARHVLKPDQILSAVLDMETGRELNAADEYLAMYLPRATDPHAPEGVRARTAGWVLTLSATAAAAGGDTLRARRLVDRIDSVGSRSLFPRDPVLHHFVEGVLLARAQNHEAAVREFRMALISPTFGYTRINYELGQSLLALNRPREAISLVQGALHGGIEGSCLYVTRTELHELLAKLFVAANEPDSAAAHYAVVTRAWSHADPAFKPRYDAAQQWLARASAHRETAAQ
ncbi:MAG: BTAD domain-containing putative transcriptional regulator, partial [Deltaproteobacteria bacterium]